SSGRALFVGPDDRRRFECALHGAHPGALRHPCRPLAVSAGGPGLSAGRGAIAITIEFVRGAAVLRSLYCLAFCMSVLAAGLWVPRSALTRTTLSRQSRSRRWSAGCTTCRRSGQAIQGEPRPASERPGLLSREVETRGAHPLRHRPSVGHPRPERGTGVRNHPVQVLLAATGKKEPSR